MATTFYPTDTASTAVVPASVTGTKLLLQLNVRGSGVQSIVNATVASLANSTVWNGTAATSPETLDGNVWITNPLNAATVTTTDVITRNIRALESNAMANYGVAYSLWLLSADGSTITRWTGTASGTELGTTEAAWTGTANPPSNLTIAQNDRLVFVGRWAAVGGTSASGYTVTAFYNGTAGGASGDTFMSLSTATLTEAVLATQVPYRNPYSQLLAH